MGCGAYLTLVQGRQRDQPALSILVAARQLVHIHLGQAQQLLHMASAVAAHPAMSLICTPACCLALMTRHTLESSPSHTFSLHARSPLKHFATTPDGVLLAALLQSLSKRCMHRENAWKAPERRHAPRTGPAMPHCWRLSAYGARSTLDSHLSTSSWPHLSTLLCGMRNT